MKKNQTKKISKNLVYVVVMVSIVISSILSIFSMRKNIVTSLSEENAEKIFSASSETIDNKEENNQVNKKFIEKISFIKQDEVNDSKGEGKDKDSKKDVAQETKNEKGTLENIGQETNNKEKEKDVAQETNKEKEKDVAQETNKEKEKNILQETNKEKERKEDKKEILEDLNYDKKEVFFKNKDSFILPLHGKIAQDFSDDKLTYSKTLDEWRVHKGVDIIAKDGASVKAVLDGYVEEIKNDAEYGMSVSIRHSQNLVSLYKSLSDDILVLPNQIIKQGDIIGFVSNTSKIENSQGAHLHFEMINKNKLVDPKIYIQFDKK